MANSRLRRSRLTRNPQFATYLVSRTASDIGFRFAMVALAFAVLDSGGGSADLGIILGAGTAPSVVFLLLGGVIGDRRDRRVIMASADALVGLSQLASALVFLLDHYSVWTIAGLQVAGGVAEAFSGPAASGVVPSIVAPHEVQHANAMLRTTRATCAIAAPAAAAVVVAASSPGAALVVDGVACIFSAVLLARLPRLQAEREGTESIVEDLRQGWSTFVGIPWAWKMVATFSVYQATVLPTIMIAGPLLAAKSTGTALWSMVLSCRALGGLFGGLLLTRWRPRRPLFVACLVVFADIPFLILLALPSWPVLLGVLAVVSASGMLISDLLFESTLQARVPSGDISRVSSFDLLGSVALNPVGSLAVGLLLTSLEPDALIIAVVAVHGLTHAAAASSSDIRSVVAAAPSRPGREGSDR
jgi:hypothetical protein